MLLNGIQPLDLPQDPFDTSNVVRMHSHFTFRNHLCIVFELLHLNLYDHLKAQDFVGLPVGALRHVATQMLRSLVFLRQQGIVHCDIKPENILLRNEWSYDVKVLLKRGAAPSTCSCVVFTRVLSHPPALTHTAYRFWQQLF